MNARGNGDRRRWFAGLLAVSMAVLLLELTLTRVFDVLFLPNLAYIIISAAVLAFGFAGVFLSVFPLRRYDLDDLLWRVACAFGSSVGLLYPVVRFVPFDYTLVPTQPLRQIGYFAILYLALLLPFFLAGLIVSVLFSRLSEISRRLYFWDLIGASSGALLMAPLIPYFGGGGLLFLAAGLGWIAASSFRGKGSRGTIALAALGLCSMVIPFTWPDTFPIDSHIEKIGLWGERTPTMGADRELTLWDQVSKIDIINRGDRRRIAYDGGTQSSTLFPFDGDYSRLRKDFGPAHYWSKGVIASHYLKADTNAQVLIIGSAGGQETKAALAFGAARVDGVELVGAVVQLVKGKYSDYIGAIFNDPRVNVVVGEGRSYLRSSQKQYDIIQIFSNHTSSMIASGAMGMSTNYLQTVEAYREYFEHLKSDGILHINHPAYPRMVTTAAAAWHELGRSDFHRHVVIVDQADGSTLPTFLVSMQAWSPQQVGQIRQLFLELYERDPRYEVLFDPYQPGRAEIAQDFFRYPLARELTARLVYQILPSTDDWPFFNFIRRRWGAVDGSGTTDIPRGIEMILNASTRRNVPLDILHVLITGVVALFYATIFLFAPLRFSEAGRRPWRGKAASLIYFSALGAGFIILELVFINVFMKMVGFPVYSYAVVIGSLLVAAGIGSLVSERVRLVERLGGRFVLGSIIGLGCLEILLLPGAFELFLSEPVWIRIAVSSLMLLPLGFFLGMPFPFGLTLLGQRVPAAVPWAWAMNGLFTVLGGLLSIVLSLLFGFRVALMFGLSFYVLAFLALPYVERGGPLATGTGDTI